MDKLGDFSMSGLTASNIGCGSHLKTSSMMVKQENAEMEKLSEISSEGQKLDDVDLDTRL